MKLAAILKEQIKNYNTSLEVSETGTVLSVGDGVARIYGMEKVMAGEMVEFPGEVMGMVLNLEKDSVGVVIFGEDREIREGDTVKRTSENCSGSCWRGFAGAGLSMWLGHPVDGRGPIETEHSRVG